jgi:two-component system NtrC family sensor kinase
MLSTVNIITIFVEIFTAGMLVAGMFSFLARFLKQKQIVDLYLGLFFLFFTGYVAGNLVSQLIFNLGASLSSLILVERFILVFLLLNTAAGWLFFSEKIKIKWLRGIPYLGVITSFVFLVLVFIGTLNLTYRHEIIEPLVTFSFPVPFRLWWIVLWAGLLILYAWQVKTGEAKFKALHKLGLLSAALFLTAQIFAFLYFRSGVSPALLFSWTATLLAVVGFYLHSRIPADSRVLEHPLNFFRTKLLYKLIFIFVLLIMLLLEGTTLAVINISKRSLSQAVIDAHKNRAVEVGVKIGGMVGDVLNQMSSVSKTVSLDRSVLNLLMNTNDMIEQLLVVDLEGNPLVSAQAERDMRGQDISNKVDKEILEKTLAVGQYLGPLEYDRGFYMLLAVPIAKPGDKDLGLLLARISLTPIQEIVAQTRVGGKGMVYLAASDGRIFAHPDLKRAYSRDSLSQVWPVARIMQGESGGGEFFDEFGDRMVGAYLSIPILRWGVVVQEPISDSYFEMRRVETYSLFFVILGIITASMVGMLFAFNIESSLEAVVKGTAAVRGGNLDYRIPIKSLDEVGQLAGAFNLMTQELKDVQLQLIRSEKLAALGTLAAGMAHEIKNPLVSIKTFTQLLLQKFDDPTFRQKFAAIIPEEINRIDKITENLLKFGRPGLPEYKKENLNEVLEEVLELLEAQFKKNQITVEKHFVDEPRVVADKGQMAQAFLNLMLNAVQAMVTSGGKLIVKTDKGAVTPQEKLKEIPVVFIEITDTGCGISEKDLPSIFDIFYTTRPAGTGMGLPITLRIIEAHGGSIKVRSKLGEGTTFIITLPQERE